MCVELPLLRLEVVLTGLFFFLCCHPPVVEEVVAALIHWPDVQQEVVLDVGLQSLHQHLHTGAEVSAVETTPSLLCSSQHACGDINTCTCVIERHPGQ